MSDDDRRRRDREFRDEHAINTDVLYGLTPALAPDAELTTVDVCEYFHISKGTVSMLVNTHREELEKAGYIAGLNTYVPARFTLECVLRIAMLLRPSTSAQARKITKALGIYRPPSTGVILDDGTVVSRNDEARLQAGHSTACRLMIDRATALVEDVRECAPEDVWDSLEKLDTWSTRAMIVTLAALVPTDEPMQTKWLRNLAELTTTDTDTTKPSAYKGLMLLIPRRGNSA